MTMEARHKRMLEETLKLPGNDTCADCHAPAPRWASVNLGIFLCVGCASVHRKMGTHKSRVKSVTLDTWTREQIVHMKEIGNQASNAIFNPNEKLHPPPPSYGHDERDSEIEKYIRKKYEMGAFKVGQKPSSMYEPTSLNRARERDSRIPFGSLGQSGTNTRNPELNDIVSFTQKHNPLLVANYKERDLPALPIGQGTSTFPARQRPKSSNDQNVPAPWATPSTNSGSTPSPSPLPQSQAAPVKEINLIDFNNNQTQNATLPLQVNMNSQNQNQNGYLMANQQQQSGISNGFSSSPIPSHGYINTNIGYGSQPLINGGMNQMNGYQNVNGFSTGSTTSSQSQGQSLSPQSQIGGYSNMVTGFLTPTSTPSPNFSSSPSFAHQPQMQFGQQPQQQQQTYNSYQPQQQQTFAQPLPQQSFVPQHQQQYQYQMPIPQQYGGGMPMNGAGGNGYMQTNSGIMMQGMGMGH
ncbi:uncharacterized protein L199_001360 [Kwoniella botswanensis]|uniref:uncharacterized protein n=1 Tax=Kwoniella botswanensis TaxID=1268659 RepID=UPI00315DD813